MAFTIPITTNLNSWSRSATGSRTSQTININNSSYGTWGVQAFQTPHTLTSLETHSRTGTTYTSNANFTIDGFASSSTGGYTTANQTGSTTLQTTWSVLTRYTTSTNTTGNSTLTVSSTDSTSASTARNGTYTSYTTVSAQSTRTIDSTTTSTSAGVATDWTASPTSTYSKSATVTTLGGTKTETSTYHTTQSGTGANLTRTTTNAVFPLHSSRLYTFSTTSTSSGTGQQTTAMATVPSWVDPYDFYTTLVSRNETFAQTLTTSPYSYLTASKTYTVSTAVSKTVTVQNTGSSMPGTETQEIVGDSTTTTTAVVSTGHTAGAGATVATNRSTQATTYSTTLNDSVVTGVYVGWSSTFVTQTSGYRTISQTTTAVGDLAYNPLSLTETTYFTRRLSVDRWTTRSAGDYANVITRLDYGAVLPSTNMANTSDYRMGFTGVPAGWLNAFTFSGTAPAAPMGLIRRMPGGSDAVVSPYSSWTTQTVSYDLFTTTFIQTFYTGSHSLNSVTLSSKTAEGVWEPFGDTVTAVGSVGTTSFQWSLQTTPINVLADTITGGANDIYGILQVGSGVYKTTRNGSTTTETGLLLGTFQNTIPPNDAISADALPVASVLPWQPYTVTEQLI